MNFAHRCAVPRRARMLLTLSVGLALAVFCVDASGQPGQNWGSDAAGIGHVGLTAYGQVNSDCNMNSSAWMTQNFSIVIPPNSVLEPTHPQAGPAYCGFFEWAMHTFMWLVSPKDQQVNGLLGEDDAFASPLFFELVPADKGGYDLVQNQPGHVPKLKVRGLKPVDGREDVQTNGAVLMAQPRPGQKYGSLVYYQVAVNDVYAYFLTALANKWPLRKDAHGAIPFPTADGDVATLKQFAQKYGLSFAKFAGRSDESALAIEIKTSWVEADTVPTNCPFPYLTRTATIPTYDTRDPRKWVVNGEKTTKLALIGMHVAGSGGGHPEMIWATFEHWCNAPNEGFLVMTQPYPLNYYPTGQGGSLPPPTKYVVPADQGGGWLLSGPALKTPYDQLNQVRMKLSGTDIVATGSRDIGPSDTLRWAPLGSHPDSIDLNTQLFNINFYALPPDGGIGNNAGAIGNYALIGAVWTVDGMSPNGSSTSAFNEDGTLSLANASMETYLQGDRKNCFACHKAPAAGQPPGTSMSHLFAHINPLQVHVTTVGSNSSTAAPSPFGSQTTGPGSGTAAPPTAQKEISNPGVASSMAQTSPVARQANVAVQSGTGAAAALVAGSAGGSNPGQGPSGAGSSETQGTLIGSQQTGNGLRCTYQLGDVTYVRTTKRATCPPTAPPPAPKHPPLVTTEPAAPQPAAASNAAQVDNAPMGQLIASQSGASGLACTYQLGSATFVRSTKRAACPQTAAPPANTTTATQQSPPGKVAKPPGVTAVTIRTTKLKNQTVRCPLTLTITGEITAAGATTVQYTWISSDGRSWPTQTLGITSAAPQTVTTPWSVGGSGGGKRAVKEWIELAVVSPNHKTSTKLPIGLTCGP